MAWYLQGEYDYERGKRVSYESKWMGDTDERLKASDAQVKAELMAKYFTPDPGPRPWPMPASIYDPVGGTGPWSGFKHPMPDKPFQLQFIEEVDFLPDCYGYMISTKIGDVIEALEPGVHQYLPCEWYDMHGRLIPEQRWMLNICNRLDTIAPEHSDIIVHPKLEIYMNGNGDRHVSIWKYKAASHAIWCEWKYGSYNYASDAFAEALQDLKIHGLMCKQHLAEI
jgi:hypothetical protein